MSRQKIKYIQRTFILLLAVVLIVTAMADPADAARRKSARAAKKPPVDRYASIVIDADTGFVLSEASADAKRYPASLTKMMTLYLTFEAINGGLLRKNDRISVSKHASVQEPSELGLEAGSTIRVEDAILGLVTKSANDAAVTLAERLGGSEDRFALMMNRKAAQLGMRSTHFVNASGLHNPSQYSSARDIATLSRALVRDYPRDYKYFSTADFTYAGHTYSNHNHLMKTYEGMDGIKTGYVYASGYNLAASSVRSGKRLIGVVFGGKTSATRNAQMAKLLDDAFIRVRDPRVAGLILQRKTAGKTAGPTSRVTLIAQATEAAAYAPAAGDDSNFDAVSLANNEDEAEGDADDAATADANAAPLVANRKVSLSEPANFGKEFQPRSLNTKVTLDQPKIAKTTTAKTATTLAYNTAPKAALGTWSVQVGAFSSHDAGMSALKNAHNRLPLSLSGNSQYVIAPLMTNRGMIYRARLSGLDRGQATQACRLLKGNCLILAVQ